MIDKLKALLKDMDALASAYYNESPVLSTEAMKWAERLRQIIKEGEQNVYRSRNDGLHNDFTY